MEVYRFMDEHMRKDRRKWGSLKRAELAAAEKFKIPAATAGDQYAKMLGSLEAARVAETLYTQADADESGGKFFGVHREPLEIDEENLLAQAFTPKELRLLRSHKPTLAAEAFIRQLAAERLELNELRRLNKSRKPK
jgi:hypothetical protein